MDMNDTPPDDRSNFHHDSPHLGALRRAEVLARKINLLLDTRLDESGKRLGFEAIYDGAEKAGYEISRTRWSMLKNGRLQVVPDSCLRALATVFDVHSGYLLDDAAGLPAEFNASLLQVRLKRLAEVRDFAIKALGPVDPEGLKAITKVLDQAIQQ
jgi:hypothetical protein